jgi:hypothetical protein
MTWGGGVLLGWLNQTFFDSDFYASESIIMLIYIFYSFNTMFYNQFTTLAAIYRLLEGITVNLGITSI